MRISSRQCLTAKNYQLLTFGQNGAVLAALLDPLLRKDYDGKVNIGKVNVDFNPEISMMYGIRNIPTILFVKGGQVVDKQVGAVPKSVLDAKVKQHL